MITLIYCVSWNYAKVWTNMINGFLYHITDHGHIHNRIALGFDMNYCKVLCIHVVPTYMYFSQKLLRSERYVSNLEIGTNLYFLFSICFSISEELVKSDIMCHMGECAFCIIHHYQYVLYTWLYITLCTSNWLILFF